MPKPVTLACKDCGEKFAHLHIRGNFPLRCAACRKALQARRRAAWGAKNRQRVLAYASAYHYAKTPRVKSAQCDECQRQFDYEVARGSQRRLCDECRPARILKAKARYRERHREKLRSDGRAYTIRRNRAAGIFERGTPASSARLSSARKATGEAHGNWKGDAAGYTAIHEWLRRHKPRTGTCVQCGRRPTPRGRNKVGTQFANLSGEYRRDLDDYVELCASCHRLMDNARKRLTLSSTARLSWHTRRAEPASSHQGHMVGD